MSNVDDLDVIIQGLLTLSVTLPPGVLITDSHSSSSGAALTPDRVVLQGLSCNSHDCDRTHFKALGLAGRCIGVCMQIDMIGGCRPGLNFSLKVQKETLQKDIASDNCCKCTAWAFNKEIEGLWAFQNAFRKYLCAYKTKKTKSTLYFIATVSWEWLNLAGRSVKQRNQLQRSHSPHQTAKLQAKKSFSITVKSGLLS